MAIEEAPVTVTRKKVWRTYRMQMFCDAALQPAQYRCEWLRSNCERDAVTGEMVGLENQNTGIVLTKTAGDLAGKTWTTRAGKVVSGADIIEVLAMAGDEFHQEKIDADAASQAAAEAAQEGEGEE